MTEGTGVEPSSTNRMPRGNETRSAVERPRAWKPSRRLPDPAEGKHPGLDHRWVRVSARNEADNLNVSQARRDGWVPVVASEYPELMIDPDDNPGSRYKENVHVGGLLLCARPKEIGDEIRAFRDEDSRRQMNDIEKTYMSEDDSRMKKFSDSDTRVAKFG